MGSLSNVRCPRFRPTGIGAGYGARVGPPLSMVGPGRLAGDAPSLWGGTEFPVVLRRTRIDKGSVEDFVLHGPRTVVRPEAPAYWSLRPYLGEESQAFQAGGIYQPGIYEHALTSSPRVVGEPVYEVEVFERVEAAIAAAALDPPRGTILAARYYAGGGTVGNLGGAAIAVPTSGCEDILVALNGLTQAGSKAQTTIRAWTLNAGGRNTRNARCDHKEGAGVVSVLLARGPGSDSKGVNIVVPYFLCEYLTIEISCFPLADFVGAAASLEVFQRF